MESEGNKCKSPNPDFLPYKKDLAVSLKGENSERMMPALFLVL